MITWGLAVNAAAVFDQTDRELWIVTARAGERVGALVATFVNQASIVPEMPRVVVGLAKQHYTSTLVEESGAFALHLIAEARLDWVWRFGLQSGDETDKLSGLACSSGTTGSPLLHGALGWLDCRVEARLDTGDRRLYLAEIVEARLLDDWPKPTVNGRLSPQAALTMQGLLRLAPPEKLQELKAQLTRDIAIDASAIQNWRNCGCAE
jgi:flavin reductase (DIM6/NTAB) family NADH-FMN oxidoreductase RutF